MKENGDWEIPSLMRFRTWEFVLYQLQVVFPCQKNMDNNISSIFLFFCRYAEKSTSLMVATETQLFYGLSPQQFSPISSMRRL